MGVIDKINEFKTELMTLNVAKIAGGSAARNMQIKVARKNIARCFTRLSQLAKAERQENPPKHVLKKHKYKGTRKLRRALTPHELSKLTRRQARKKTYKNLRYPVLLKA